MKKLPILGFLLLAAFAFASGQKEQQSINLTLLLEAYPEERKEAVSEFLTENPNVSVEVKLVDLSDGSTLTMDAMLAAGTAPNVYLDYMGRISKYIVPEFALSLGKYMSDLNDYKPGILDPVTRDGQVLALPQTGNAQGMSLNLNMFTELGEAVPTNATWTVDNFLRLSGKVKSKYGGEKYGTGMFAANQSGDYLYMNWLSSFGAEIYADGYIKTVIKSPQGLYVFDFWKSIYDKGYIEKESPVLTDDDYVLSWAQGKYLATAFFPAWVATYQKTALEQGLIKEPHKFSFVRFPAAPGISKVPATTNYGGIVVKKTDDEKINKASARLAWYMNNKEMQEKRIKLLEIGNRKSVTVKNDDPYWQQIAVIVDQNGTLDLGLTTPYFSAVRTQMFPRLQAMWTGKETPVDALVKYETAVNKILRGE